MTPPLTRTAITEGLQAGLHPGAQLYVSVRGEVLADEAFGAAREGVPMERDLIMLWFSAGKPITAVAIGQLVERGALRWETRVAEVILEFAQQGKESITIRDLLTHTAGLRPADNFEKTLTWDERTANICALPLEENWIPGQRAGYHASGTWHLLGEVVRRIDGRDINTFTRENILAPLGMRASSLAMTPEDVELFGNRIALVYDTSDGTARPKTGWNSVDGMVSCRPGGTARGPIRELGRFYESLLRDGERILRPETVATMTSRQREGMFDETFQFKTDCGFGFILNSNHGSFQMPYGYGRHASRETFGHSGNQCSCAFADPRHQLVVAWACTGLPGERNHQRRQRAINNAIYEDLGLTGETSE